MADRDAKAKLTDTVARQIIDSERAAIDKKSERLRKLREAQEAANPVEPAPAKKPAKAKKKKA